RFNFSHPKLRNQSGGVFRMFSRTACRSKANTILVALLIVALNFSALLPVRAQTPAQPPAQPQTPASPQSADDAKKSAPDKPKDQEKPFADVVKDAEVVSGLFTLYRKDDKVYLEILPDQFDKVYLFSPTLESGIGERGVLSAQVMGGFAFTFHKFGKNVQLI